MASNSRAAVAAHVMVSLSLSDGRASSARLAESVNTNPVVIRRILAELQRAGLVRTCAGKSGGAELARPANAITLREICVAVDDAEAFAPNPNAPNPGCSVSCAMSAVLGPIFARAEDAMLKSLESWTLAEVAEKAASAARKKSFPKPAPEKRRDQRRRK